MCPGTELSRYTEIQNSARESAGIFLSLGFGRQEGCNSTREIIGRIEIIGLKQFPCLGTFTHGGAIYDFPKKLLWKRECTHPAQLCFRVWIHLTALSY